tara:strand:- start:12162 stop:12596 length:435 start_codon:yes stop_codon:yes gene_type:complete
MNTETMTNYQPTLNSIHAQAIRENSVLLKIQKNTNPKGMNWIALFDELTELKNNWSTNPNNPKTFGDAGFLQVKASTHKGWKIAKQMCNQYSVSRGLDGRKHYDGWVFFSASTNDNIFEMYCEVQRLIEKHNCNDMLWTTERQL